MSVASQFSGGGIKSIQRGTISAYSASATATITAVNTSKTMLNFCGVTLGYVSGYYTSNPESAYISLTNSTTVTVNNRAGSMAVPPTVSYEVIEFY